MDSLVLKCENCQKYCSTVSRDKEHVVCSHSCENKVLGDPALLLNAADMHSLPQSSPPSSITGREELPILTVRGHGEVKATPDRIQATLVIIRKDKDSAVVSEKLITAVQFLINVLTNKTEGKASKIQTENMRIEPIYAPQPRDRSYDERERVIIGYEGTFPIRFESLVKDAGFVIEKALKDNVADNVRDMNYIVSDELAQPGYQAALKIASLDALKQADSVLYTLQMKRLNILSINIESGGSKPVPRFSSEESYSFYKQKSVLSTAKRSIDFLAPEHTISANVSMTLSYK